MSGSDARSVAAATNQAGNAARNAVLHERQRVARLCAEYTCFRCCAGAKPRRDESGFWRHLDYRCTAGLIHDFLELDPATQQRLLR